MTVQLRFPREAPELGRRKAEERLFAELDANAEQYAKDEDFGRRAAREAILSVLNSLLDRGLSSQAAKIFGDVAEALSDVEKGTLPEIFDPNAGKRAGREGRRVWTRSSKGKETYLYLGACAEALRRTTEMNLPEIFNKVARHAQNWPRVSSGIITAGRVKDALNQYRPSRKGRGSTTQFEHIVQSLSEGPNARYLEEVLADGPPLTGGTRKQKI
jgi:hypothetical protein